MTRCDLEQLGVGLMVVGVVVAKQGHPLSSHFELCSLSDEIVKISG